MSCCTGDILLKATCNCMGKGSKMDGWETTFLSFWDTAYFQGRTCCEFQGGGKLSTDTISTNLKHKGEIRWLILV